MLLRSVTIVTVSALVIAGCATMTVSSHLERGVNFQQYRTYDWGPADALPTGDPRLDNNPFFHDYLQGSVEKQLATKGLVKATSGDADLLLHYHANVNHRFEVNGVDRQYGYCYGDCQPQVIEYEQGTLVIDVVDAKTNKVVWRGWAQDSVEGIIDNQERLERQISEAVTRMMTRFPAAF
jgi:hypothetical protein